MGQDGGALIAVAAHLALATNATAIDAGTVLAECAAELITPAFRSVVDVVGNTLDTADPAEVARLTGSGIAAHEAAPAALAAYLHHPTDPTAAITFAITMGHDTDTVAAMAGSLAGVLAGHDRIPEHLLTRLERRDELTQAADALADRTYAWRAT